MDDFYSAQFSLHLALRVRFLNIWLNLIQLSCQMKNLHHEQPLWQILAHLPLKTVGDTDVIASWYEIYFPPVALDELKYTGKPNAEINKPEGVYSPDAVTVFLDRKLLSWPF